MNTYSQLEDYDFFLPDHLIAQEPPTTRGQSRLMVLSTSKKTIIHSRVSNLANHIPSNARMVFNNSKVRKARMYGRKFLSDQSTEFLLLQPIEFGNAHSLWLALVSKAKKQKVGDEYLFPESIHGRISQEKEEGLKLIEFSGMVDEEYLNRWGHMPLPPYIKREDTENDEDRYQTIYSKEVGSAAAPTAGLHFTQELLDDLQRKGIERTEITLHVGLGTFLPVRVQNILDHRMHSEEFLITESAAKEVTTTKNHGRPIVAVGTTSVRTLESAWNPISNILTPGHHQTDIFIYPGYRFTCVDMLFTNFHTPKSTLVMLVSAFSDRDFILEAYKEAVKEEYRFFSYGDAMLILP